MLLEHSLLQQERQKRALYMPTKHRYSAGFAPRPRPKTHVAISSCGCAPYESNNHGARNCSVRGTRQVSSSDSAYSQNALELKKSLYFGRNKRTGAATVEFAIVSPLLLMLLLGLIEFGRFFMVEQVVTNAAREGARNSVVTGATVNSVNSAVGEYLKASGISSYIVSITPDVSQANTGDRITVSVSVSYGQVSWLPTTTLRWLGTETITAQAVMRKEAR
ncbi:MAG: hypothetical protein C4296_07645 [Gemmataceae bacterium]